MKQQHTDRYDLYGKLKGTIDFSNKKILDFGGSFGNLIESSNGNILPNNYTCVDVDNVALNEGRKNFPDANWIWYDRYNTMYNPRGSDIWPKLSNYDLVFSYSVFSHSSYEDLISTIEYFKTILFNKGEIYISYPSQTNSTLIKWLREKRTLQYGSCDEIIPNSTYLYLKDNKIINTTPNQSDHFFTLYNDNHLKELGEIVVVDNLFQNFLRIVNNK